MGAGEVTHEAFFSFWWMCAKKAFWGNTAFANDWQWVFGVPAVTGLVGFLASNKGASEQAGSAMSIEQEAAPASS
jgi:hypothetical protein